MINYEDAEKALEFLKATDVSFAKSRALKDALDESKKTVAAIEFMHATGSAAERQQIALSSEAYITHLGKMESATLEFETLKNRRMTAALQIEMWRSINSNMKKGNI